MNNSDKLMYAESLLAILMMDLGYEKKPGKNVPLRHQIAWDIADDILGGDEVANLLRAAIDIKESGSEKTLRPHDVSEGHRRIVQMTARIKELEAITVELESLLNSSGDKVR